MKDELRKDVVASSLRLHPSSFIIISLGSNIEKERNLPLAVQLLAQRLTVVACSSVYETAPMGTTNQPAFWNAAVLVQVKLAEPADQIAHARTIKNDMLSDIEQQLKRVRTADKNAPRTIDLDLTFYGDSIFDFAGRHIPDPDTLKFAHVAVPVGELLPDWPHPETGESLGAIAKRLLAEANRTTRNIWKRNDLDLFALDDLS